MNKTKTATILDVAKTAGVSKGTVDRVLHNRGEVSESSRAKVLEAIKTLNYEPNIHATLLSLKRQYNIIAIMPNFQPGEYWEQVYNGIQMIRNDEATQKISIEIIYFNQFDYESFNTACTHTMSLRPSGVLVAPMFKDRATQLIEDLHQLGIPSACIDSVLEKTNYLTYYGIPQFESGYLAAHMLMNDKHNNACEIAHFTLDWGIAPPNQSTHNRHKGIVAYANDHNIDCKIHQCIMYPNNFIENMYIFDRFFEEHPDIDKLITLNSRAYMVAEWLELRRITNKTFVGFDALRKNVDGLKRGYISTIIAERTTLHVYKAIDAIIKYLVFKHTPEKKNNFTPMDILNRYNVDFY